MHTERTEGDWINNIGQACEIRLVRFPAIFEGRKRWEQGVLPIIHSKCFWRERMVSFHWGRTFGLSTRDTCLWAKASLLTKGPEALGAGVVSLWERLLTIPAQALKWPFYCFLDASKVGSLPRSSPDHACMRTPISSVCELCHSSISWTAPPDPSAGLHAHVSSPSSAQWTFQTSFQPRILCQYLFF